MSLTSAMTAKFITLSADDPAEKALAALKKAGADSGVVVDSNGRLEGVLSIQSVLRNLLPVSVVVGNSPVSVGAAPGVAKRLNKISALRVADVMDRKAKTLPPEASLLDALNVLLETPSPVYVADSASGKVLGQITTQSIYDELNRMKDTA